MISERLLKIERSIIELSSQEKLWLVERIIRQLREEQISTNLVSDIDLSEMANDPQIQAEIAAIESEFAITELDGLPNS
jgi:hypothetical protein